MRERFYRIKRGFGRAAGAVCVLLLLTACGNASPKEQESIWEPPVEGLTWGMSSSEAEKLYPFEESGERKEGTFRVSLQNPVPVCGIDAEVTLSFYESGDISLGLQSMAVQCPEEHTAELEEALAERFKSTDAVITDSGWLSWETEETVSDYYTSAQLLDAYEACLGEAYLSEHMDYYNEYISGISRSYLALFRYKREGEDKGFMEINGTRIAEMRYLFGDGFSMEKAH